MNARVLLIFLALIFFSIRSFAQAKWTTHYRHFWADSEQAWKDALDPKKNGIEYVKDPQQELLMAWGFRQASEDVWYFSGAVYDKDSALSGNSYNIRLTKMFGSNDGGLTKGYRGVIERPLQNKYDMLFQLEEVVENLPGGSEGQEVSVEVKWEYNLMKISYTEDSLYHVYWFYDPAKSGLMKHIY